MCLVALIIFRGFQNSTKLGHVLYFVQLYEMHTNDIIMVTGSNADMQIKIQRYVQMLIVHT